jgi:hypothetical protein
MRTVEQIGVADAWFGLAVLSKTAPQSYDGFSPDNEESGT